MKKHILAAAVAAAVAAPAFAQSSVEIYGRLDVGYSDLTAKVKGSGTDTLDSSVAANDNSQNWAITGGGKHRSTDWGNGVSASPSGTGGYTGSRLGFRGTEDLGGGLKAKFLFEIDLQPNRRSAVAANPGATSALSDFTNREAWVGVQGNFGEIRIGNQYTPHFNLDVMTDSTGANNMVGGRSALSGFGQSNSQNSIRYYTPNFNGFTASLMAGSENQKQNSTKTRADMSALGVNYESGPLKVGLTSSKFSATAAATVVMPVATAELTAVGISNNSYTMPAASQSAFFTDLFDNFGATAAQDDDVSFTRPYLSTVTSKNRATVNALGASYNFGVATVTAFYFDRNQSYKEAKVKTPATGYRLGITVPLTSAVSLIGTMSSAEFDTKKDDAVVSVTTVDGAAPAVTVDSTSASWKIGSKRDAYNIGALYAFSKRTTLYALYGHQRDTHKLRSTASYAVSSAVDAATFTTTGKVKDTRDQFAFGIRHDF